MTVPAEPGEETPLDPRRALRVSELGEAVSLHDMRRIGLIELYEQRNWVWQAPAS